MGPAQLAEQHGHELAPTGKPARVALRLMLLDGSFKLDSRKQLQQLAENTAYSLHGESLDFGDLVLARTHPTVAELSPLSLNQSGDSQWKSSGNRGLQSNPKYDI